MLFVKVKLAIVMDSLISLCSLPSKLTAFTIQVTRVARAERARGQTTTDLYQK